MYFDLIKLYSVFFFFSDRFFHPKSFQNVLGVSKVFMTFCVLPWRIDMIHVIPLGLLKNREQPQLS